jgi:hypothetical protein
LLFCCSVRSYITNVEQNWCDRTYLSDNPKKTVLLSFTKKRDVRGRRMQSCSVKALVSDTKTEQGADTGKAAGWDNRCNL